MKKIIEKAKQILHDADSGSDECKHYNNGFLDGIKFAERELKNCNLQSVISSFVCGHPPKQTYLSNGTWHCEKCGGKWESIANK